MRRLRCMHFQTCALDRVFILFGRENFEDTEFELNRENPRAYLEYDIVFS